MIQEHAGQQRIPRNVEDYTLDMRSRVGQRITNRNWHEFSIRQEEGLFVLERRPKPEALLPHNVDHAVVPPVGEEDARVMLAGIPVSLTVGVRSPPSARVDEPNRTSGAEALMDRGDHGTAEAVPSLRHPRTDGYIS